MEAEDPGSNTGNLHKFSTSTFIAFGSMLHGRRTFNLSASPVQLVKSTRIAPFSFFLLNSEYIEQVAQNIKLLFLYLIFISDLCL